jgi:cell division septation protein DedD
MPIPAPAPGVPRPPTPAAPGAKPEEQLRIVADPATNSLIIYGTAQEFQNIKNILKELDAVPRQVLLDVLVAEVTLSDNQSLGVDYEVLRRNPSSIFGQKFGSAGAIRTLGDLFPTTASGFGGGVSGVFGGKDIKALVNALQSDSRFKVLSSPSILATDNRPARIQVGTEEPIATGTIAQAVGGVAQSTSIQYRNTGRIVTIIPQVNSQGLVNLQILAEVSQRRSDSVKVGTDFFPAFDTRQAETTAVVQDGESLVIGGIITDTKSRTRSGIPYLMDLPIIGRFFGTTSDEIDRTELIMLITPNVIRNRDESRFVTDDFKSKLLTVRNELEKMRIDREKDLEKLKRQAEEQKPAPQPPPAVEPPAPPVSAPARPDPSVGPATAPAPPVPSVSQSTPSKSTAPVAQEARSQVEKSVTPRAARADPAKTEAPVRTADTVEALIKEKEINQAMAPEREKPPAPLTKPKQVWTVQVASFALEKDAENLARKLTERGYDVYIFPASVGGKTHYRVQVGQLATRQQAVELQKTLQASEKFENTLVASR